ENEPDAVRAGVVDDLGGIEQGDRERRSDGLRIEVERYDLRVGRVDCVELRAVVTGDQRSDSATVRRYPADGRDQEASEDIIHLDVRADRRIGVGPYRFGGDVRGGDADRVCRRVSRADPETDAHLLRALVLHADVGRVDRHRIQVEGVRRQSRRVGGEHEIVPRGATGGDRQPRLGPGRRPAGCETEAVAYLQCPGQCRKRGGLRERNAVGVDEQLVRFQVEGDPDVGRYQVAIDQAREPRRAGLRASGLPGRVGGECYGHGDAGETSGKHGLNEVWNARTEDERIRTCVQAQLHRNASEVAPVAAAENYARET